MSKFQYILNAVINQVILALFVLTLLVIPQVIDKLQENNMQHNIELNRPFWEAMCQYWCDLPYYDSCFNVDHMFCGFYLQ